MWGHPVIDELFRPPGVVYDARRGRLRLLRSIMSAPPADPVDTRREATLGNLLDELTRLGEVTFTRDRDTDADPSMVVTCRLVVEDLSDDREFSAAGLCVELAALRCLMEALESMERQARLAAAALQIDNG